jgi:hypothetical protein
MGDLRYLERHWSALAAQPSRPHRRAFLSAVIPGAFLALTVLAPWTLRASDALMALGYIDALTGSACLVTALTAWRAIRGSEGGEGTAWAGTGAVASVVLVLLGILTAILVSAVNGISSIPG